CILYRLCWVELWLFHFFLMNRRQLYSYLFPYTPLFRSRPVPRRPAALPPERRRRAAPHPASPCRGPAARRGPAVPPPARRPPAPPRARPRRAPGAPPPPAGGPSTRSTRPPRRWPPPAAAKR